MDDLLRDQESISPTSLQKPFTSIAPKSIRILPSCQYLFTLLGSTCAKASHKMMMNLTPGVNLTNILHTAFTFVDPKSAKKTNKDLTVFFVLSGFARVKAAHKMLVKLTHVELLSRV